jgi:hypothetical protein
VLCAASTYNIIEQAHSDLEKREKWGIQITWNEWLAGLLRSEAWGGGAICRGGSVLIILSNGGWSSHCKQRDKVGRPCKTNRPSTDLRIN